MDDGLFVLMVVGVGVAIHFALRGLDRALERYRMRKNGRGW